ncbi:MAG TPA: alpha/beta hydrolase [Blastocatellia bacterium]|nr:alpha/beta hydrolase [Blastocatellia bacterium]
MSSGDIKQVREMIASLPDWAVMEVPETRAFYDQLGQQFPVPDGVTVEATNAGGVKAEWVRAAGCRTDAVLLYVHGGGYIIGSPASHRHQVAAISQAAGIAVLSLDYRLGPEHPFPAAVDDAVAAYQWLLQSDIAPNRIVVAGDSAGGGLTVATLLALRERGLPQAAAGVCISPWVDLTITAESYTTKAALDPLVTRDGVTGMAQGYLQGQEAQTPLASPLFADLSGLPPLLIQVGTDEVLLDDAVKLEAKAKAAGVDATLEIWDEMIHVWHFFYPVLSEGREAIARIGAFVQARIA